MDSYVGWFLFIYVRCIITFDVSFKNRFSSSVRIQFGNLFLNEFVVRKYFV